MVVQTRRMTVDEFDHVVTLPEYRDRLLEFIGGEVVEVVSNQRSSAIAAQILILLGAYVTQNKLGFVTGADGGYMIAGERYIPDVAYVSAARQSALSEEAYSSIPPDLAVEVLSPSNDPDDMRIKVIGFLHAGTTVWVVNPDKKRVEVYIPGAKPKTLDATETLNGDPVLPGFTLALNAIFPADETNEEESPTAE